MLGRLRLGLPPGRLGLPDCLALSVGRRGTHGRGRGKWQPARRLVCTAEQASVRRADVAATARELATADEALEARRTSSAEASTAWSRKDAMASFESQLSEFEYNLDDLIEGQLPAALQGTYLRNGPGRFERDVGYQHPFDGDGFIQQLTIRDGRAFVRAKYIRTAEYEAEEMAGKVLYRNAFGTQRQGGPAANAWDLKLKNVANTAAVLFGGRLLALWEAAQPHLLDQSSLGTLGLDTLGGADSSPERTLKTMGDPINLASVIRRSG